MAVVEKTLAEQLNEILQASKERMKEKAAR